MEVENKQILFKAYIDGTPLESDMDLKSDSRIELKAPKGSAGILVKNLYLSCDPYMRGRFRPAFDSYIPPFVPGQPVEGFGVARVVDSDDPDYKAGDVICGFVGWEEYSLVCNKHQLRKIQQEDDIPLSYQLVRNRGFWSG